MKTYGVGTKAFYDTFTGLVPVTVIKINGPSNGRVVGKGNEVEFIVDKDHGPYKKGERLMAQGYKVVPRPHRVLRHMFYRINTDYEWRE